MNPKPKKPKPQDSTARRLKKTSRGLRHALTMPLVRALAWTLARLPHGFVLFMGRCAGRAGFAFGGARAARAVRQLLETGVAANEKQARLLARRSFEAAGMYAFELPHALGWDDAHVRRQLVFEGLEHRLRAETGGRGVIYAICHMGNWELMGRAYALETGRNIHTAMSSASNPALTEWLQAARARYGTHVLHDEGRGLAFVRKIRQGFDVAFLADQDSKKYRGVFVDFFGRPARTPEGPALLARKLGVPLICCATRRDPADPRRQTATLSEPIMPDASLDEPADIQRITQAYTKVFEGWIRASPQDWSWMHDRWRRKQKK